MKKLKRILVGLLAVTVLSTTTGCYGSFKLSKTVYEWNGKATDNKWANSIIMWGLIIVPVYEFSMFVDFVILNTVEFWTGSNPLAMNEGESDTQIIESGNKVFEVTATKNQFRIEQTKGEGNGKSIDLNYKANEAAWYISDGNKEYKLAQGDINNKEWIKVFHPDGKVEEIALK